MMKYNAIEHKVDLGRLTDEKIVNLQQYISRIYGSMTSFNVLFQNKEDCFIGAKSQHIYILNGLID